MIKGLYSAASAMLAEVQREQLLVHNVANLTTPGFKQIMSSLDDFMSTQVYNPTTEPVDPNPQTIGDLGLGVENAPDTTDFSQGGLQSTGNDLDVAIEGDGFFRVRTPDGERYTRDGRFLRDSSGQLVTVDGYQVLNAAGQPIKLPAGQVEIGLDGTISVDGTQAGKIGLANFAKPATDLQRDANNTFSATNPPSGTANGQLHQRYLEGSNANASQIATMMVTISRSYQAAQQMVQSQDELLGETISSLGRVG